MGRPEENEMGWLIGWDSKASLVEHLLRQEGGNCDVLKHSLVGNNLWMLMRRKRDGLKFVVLAKLTGRRGGGPGGRDWGYKSIDETMGPCETNCPLYLIDAADPPPDYGYAAEWRARCRADRAAKAGGKKFAESLKPGDKFQYGSSVVEFAGWMERRNGRKILTGYSNGKLYRWTVSKVRPLGATEGVV